MDDTTSEEVSVSFKALFQSARTTIDGGWRVTLDLTHDEVSAVSKLLQIKSKVLQIAVIPIIEESY